MRSPRSVLGLVLIVSSTLQCAGMEPTLVAAQEREAPPGYTDTPWLPGGKWRVHDAARPYPPVVAPGPGDDLMQPPPHDAIVLMSAPPTQADLERWRPADAPGEPARWDARDGALVPNGTGSIASREEFGDAVIHLEWATPAAEGQAGGNSGVFLMGRYEVQILDSWRNATYADGQAAALYGQAPPSVNASRPPGDWQSFDILFTAPRFEGETLLSPAWATVWHNGVVVHQAQAFLGSTVHREVASYSPHPATGPLVLQDHGDLVRFRNVWVVPLSGLDAIHALLDLDVHAVASHPAMTARTPIDAGAVLAKATFNSVGGVQIEVHVGHKLKSNFQDLGLAEAWWGPGPHPDETDLLNLDPRPTLTSGGDVLMPKGWDGCASTDYSLTDPRHWLVVRVDLHAMLPPFKRQAFYYWGEWTTGINKSPMMLTEY